MGITTLINKRLKKHARILKEIKDENYILLNYQMGKVGSSSVSEYFRRVGRLEWHNHRFTDHFIHEKANKNLFLKMIDLALLKLCFLLGKKVKIITAFREPISRNVSMFFETFAGTYPTLDIAQLSTEKLLEMFEEKFPHRSGVDWFDKEFNKVFPIDIYAHEFDKARGYTIIRDGNVEVFLYRLDNLSDLTNQIKCFLECPDYELISTNVGGEKEYANQYQCFKNLYQPSRDLVESLYTSKSMIHFYNDSEIKSFRSRWLQDD